MGVGAAGRRAALLVSHPGHELRVHGWLHRNRPLVFVLTDGSGSAGSERVGWTRRLVEGAGARPAPLFGVLSDRSAYADLLDGNHRRFQGLLGDVVDGLVAESIEQLVIDAAEGYNPMHDVCHLIGATAARLARRRTGRAIEVLSLPLTELCGDGPAAVDLALGAEELDVKTQAALAHPQLGGEADAMLRSWGQQALGRETLHALPRRSAFETRACREPYYERVGLERVAAGRYRRVIRFEEHVAPLVRSFESL